MQKKILKDIVKKQELTIGLVQQVVYPEITEYLAMCGLDYLILDLEHTAHTIEAVNPCLLAAAARNIPVLIRVWEKEQCLIEQALDAGAQGIVVPTIETVEDCKMVVRAAKFAPEGTRGFCNVIPPKRWMNEWENDPYGDDFSPDTYCKIANRDIFVAVLVETPLGIENLPEMLKVDGIDAFLIGSGDISVRIGKSPWGPEVAEIVTNAIKQIHAAGKISCPVGIVGNVEMLYEGGSRMMMLGMGERACMQDRIRSEVNGMREIAARLK